jgi:CRP/FNR family transcriptional regulator
MSDQIIPLHGLKGSKNDCSKCSIQLLCLPAAIGADDFDRLNTIVQKRRPLKRGNVLFSSGQKLDCIYVRSRPWCTTAAATAM